MAKVMIMNRKLPPLLVLVSGLIGLASWAESTPPSQPLPTPFPEVRYQQMSAKSPFAVATASSAATAAPTPGFAAQLYVDGVAHVGKTDFVAIKSRDPDQPAVIFLEVGKSAPDGMKAERVQWSDEMGKSTVDVSKNGEKATLIFDEAQLAKNASAVPAVMPGQPGIRLPTMPGQGRPVGFPLQNRGLMQPGGPFAGPRAFPQPGAPPGPDGMNNGNSMRRRIRTIQSGQ
jgi:hypothetical protein